MDWFLYDRDLRHERVKYDSVLSIEMCKISPFSKKMFWKFSVTHRNVFMSNNTPSQIFDQNLSKYFQNSSFIEHFWKTASEYRKTVTQKELTLLSREESSKNPRWSSFLTHFSPVSHFYVPWKHQKTYGFLTSSGGMEMWHWTKMS